VKFHFFAVALLASFASSCTKPNAETKEQRKLVPSAPSATKAAPTATSSTAKADSTDSKVVNAIALPTASVAAWVNPDNLPAYNGPTGAIEGTIWVTGDPAQGTPADFTKCPEASSTWGHAFREGMSPAVGAPKPEARPLEDAVVVVTGYKGFFVPEKKESKDIVIDGCAYKERTVTLTFGQRLDVRNLSKDFWAPILQPRTRQVTMMAAPKADPVRLYPQKPGHWLLVDADRKYAVVDVYAFLHPLHASTDARGHYRIDGVPVGPLRVSTMHPHVTGNAEADIDVQANVVHNVDLVLKNEAAATAR